MPALVTISVIRDEADVIEAWVRRHAPLTLRMLIVLHRSRDGTARILRRLREEGFPLDIRRSRARHYPQAELIDVLLREAAAIPGAAWVLPLDADEFLAHPAGDVERALAHLPCDRVTLLPWRTYVPTPGDDHAERHVLDRITHRRAAETPSYGKVLLPAALAADPDTVLPLGNHAAQRASTGETLPAAQADGLFLAHVPVRSEAQLRNKVLRGWESHRRTPGRKPGQIFQWETLYERCSDPRPIEMAELSAIARNYASSGETALVRDPVRGPHRVPRHHARRRFLPFHDPIRLAATSNESYAIDMAVTVRSALDALDPGRHAEVTVLEEALRPETRRRLLESWRRPRTRVRFVPADLSRIGHLKLTQGMRPVTYCRLLLPEILSRADRVLYLDSDMLVLDDLSAVWETDLQGRPMAAVRDVLLSTTLTAIPHHRDVGLNPDAPYFSSALILMDLDVWRREDIGRRTIRFVEEHPDCIRWWDQDGLNAVINGNWLQLDPRWNVYAEAASLLGWNPPPEREAEVARLIAEQRLIHFATRYKPWKHACRHPKTALFFQTLDRTAWRGWRPDPSSEIPYPPQKLS